MIVATQEIKKIIVLVITEILNNLVDAGDEFGIKTNTVDNIHKILSAKTDFKDFHSFVEGYKEIFSIYGIDLHTTKFITYNDKKLIGNLGRPFGYDSLAKLPLKRNIYRD